MKQYLYLMISLIFIVNSGQLFCQSDLKIESRFKHKGKTHRDLTNQTRKSLINKDELIAIGNRLKGYATSSRSLSKVITQHNQFNNKSPRKLVKINNTLVKNNINKSNSSKSFVRNNFKLTENLINGSGLQSVKKDKMEDGEEWIAVMDYLEENRSLFLTRPIINDFDIDIKELSTTQILESGTPITVLTNGSAIIFVDVENNIKLIKTDGTDEEIISSNPVWYSVSISPDGSKLALIPNDIEPYIYISDLNNPDNSSKIRIYNPLAVDTINDTTLQYADVLTWSADGQNIYYDCLVAEADGNEYWTINLLNVNNGDNTQLFELEDAMQVWGPSASNNGEYLLLDLHDTKTDSVTILLVDFNQDLPGIIEENGNSISNARFSPLDDMVVFEYFDSLNGSIVPILSKIELSEDKRIPASPSAQFIDSFRYPVWFIVGGIPVSVEMDETKTVTEKFSLSQNYPNPFNPTTAISYSIPNINFGMSVQLKIYDVLGNEITTLVNEVQSPGNYTVNVDGSRLSSGIYYYQLKAGNFRESRKMLLLK
jgi:hypothetical protein